MGDASMTVNQPDQFKKLIKLFDVSHMGLWEMNADGIVYFYNEGFYKHLNIPVGKSSMEDWLNIIHPDDLGYFKQGLVEHESSKSESFKSVYRVINPQGDTLWIEAQGIATFDEAGHISWMVGTHSDITIKKNYRDQLFHAAYVDKLTELYNRKWLVDCVDRDIERNIKSTLVFIDFHMVSKLESVYGKAIIDGYIYEIGSVLKDLFDIDFTLFRVSVSRFVMLSQQDPSNEPIIDNMSTFEQEHRALLERYDIDENVAYAVAVMRYPFTDENLNAHDVLNRADYALQEAMKRPTEKVFFYTKDTNYRILKQHYIETSIPKAIKRGDIYPVFHPIISTRGGYRNGFEALCRWHDIQWGNIYPDEFIGIAENNRTITEIGKFMIKEACKFIKHYNNQNRTDLFVSINASVVELMQLGYCDFVMDTIHEYGLSPKNVAIEITESIMLDQNPDVLSQLTRLAMLGVGVALDDFGSGYASLNTMIYTPLTKLKIDKAIMTQVMENDLLMKYLTSLVELCHDHDVAVIAEGIETKDMVVKALDMNIDYLQGFIYAKPMTADAALRYLLPEIRKQ